MYFSYAGTSQTLIPILDIDFEHLSENMFPGQYLEYWII